MNVFMLSLYKPINKMFWFKDHNLKQVAQWATIGHDGPSIMFEDTIIYDAQRQVILNSDQKLIQKHKI